MPGKYTGRSAALLGGAVYVLIALEILIIISMISSLTAGLKGASIKFEGV